MSRPSPPDPQALTGRAPLFVIGHGRSGTTLVRLLLNQLPDLAIPPESNLVSHLRRAEARGLDFGDDEALRAAIAHMFRHPWFQEGWVAERGFDPQQLTERILAAPRGPAGWMDAMMSAWAEAEGASRWGEKVPGNYRFLPDIERWYPDCRLLHVLRDGRDVALSCLTPPFSDRFDMGDEYEVGMRWRHAVREARAAEARLGPERFAEVRYEDLVQDPNAVLEKLCGFLGLPFDPAMLAYHEHYERNVPPSRRDWHRRLAKGIDRARVGRWAREASPEFVAGFEGIALRELVACGYEPSGYDPSALQRARIAWERWRPRRSLTKHYKPVGKRLRQRLRRLTGGEEQEEATAGG